MGFFFVPRSSLNFIPTACLNFIPTGYQETVKTVFYPYPVQNLPETLYIVGLRKKSTFSTTSGGYPYWPPWNVFKIEGDADFCNKELRKAA